MEQREGIVGVSRSSSARDRRSQLILITWVNGFYVIGNWSLVWRGERFRRILGLGAVRSSIINSRCHMYHVKWCPRLGFKFFRVYPTEYIHYFEMEKYGCLGRARTASGKTKKNKTSPAGFEPTPPKGLPDI